MSSLSLMHKLKIFLPYLFLSLFSIPLFYMNVHDRHSWGGDDYALYIKEAKNISEGIPFYKTNYVFYDRNLTYSPPQYPPGFPLLLAPIVKIFGLSIRSMCYFITAMAVAFMLTVFVWLRGRKVGEISAFCISLVVGYSWFLLDTKEQILSDIPCLLFTMLYLTCRRSNKFKVWRIVVIILLGSAAILIRTQAVLLLIAEVMLFIYSIGIQLYSQRRIEKKTLVPFLFILPGILLLNAVLSNTVFQVPFSTVSFYGNYLKSVLHDGVATLFRNNVNFLIEVFNNCFYYPTDSGFRTAMVTIMQGAGLTLFLTGFVIAIRKAFALEDIFFLLVSFMILYYPIHDKRYFLPALPLVYYYCYYALKALLPAVTKIKPQTIGIIFTIVCFSAGLKYLKESTIAPQGYVQTENDQKAFNYLATHVSDTDIILFSRPRFLTLYTNKRSMVQAWLLPMDQNRQIFDSMHVKYALTVKGLADDFNNHYLTDVQRPLDTVVIAEGYTLYKLR